MKRLVILLAIVMASITMVNAQGAKLQAASNYVNSNPPKLGKAMDAIEKAAVHKKTINRAKTWFVRGNIYLKIALSDNPEFKALSENPLKIAEESYNKCTELDSKGEYLLNIRQNMQLISDQYYVKGVEDFQLGDYGKAITFFERVLDINKNVFNVTDTTAIFNISLCAARAEDMGRAKIEYEKLVELGYNKPSIFTGLSNIYVNEGDTVKAFETIARGRELMPSDFNILIAETNLYLDANETEKALANLEKALEFDATNPQIFFAVGAQYESMIKDNGDKEQIEMYRAKAIENYKKALEINPEYFDAIFNLGAINVNIASSIISVANELPFDKVKEYDALIAEANGYLEAALPYLEKAHQMQPQDMSTLVTLKEIYVRLKMNDKLPGITEKIEALKK
jgi:tetratricopeptide (TPR) repeat protein